MSSLTSIIFIKVPLLLYVIFSPLLIWGCSIWIPELSDPLKLSIVTDNWYLLPPFNTASFVSIVSIAFNITGGDPTVIVRGFVEFTAPKSVGQSTFNPYPPTTLAFAKPLFKLRPLTTPWKTTSWPVMFQWANLSFLKEKSPFIIASTFCFVGLVNLLISLPVSFEPSYLGFLQPLRSKRPSSNSTLEFACCSNPGNISLIVRFWIENMNFSSPGVVGSEVKIGKYLVAWTFEKSIITNLLFPYFPVLLPSINWSGFLNMSLNSNV